jgi:hypothetical protein
MGCTIGADELEDKTTCETLRCYHHVSLAMIIVHRHKILTFWVLNKYKQVHAVYAANAIEPHRMHSCHRPLYIFEIIICMI